MSTVTKKRAVRKTAKRATTRKRATTPSLVRPTWTTACPDWENRIETGIPITPCPPLFPTSAASGMEIFNQLQIVDAGVTFGDIRPWSSEFAE